MHRSGRAGLVAAVVVGLAACSPAEPGPEDLGPLPLDAWIATNLPDGASLNHADPAVEEAKARCMAEQGFTYVPARGVEVTSVEIAEPPGPARGTRAFAEHHGYGIAWQLEEYPPQDEEAAEPDPSDPNEQLRQAMSETELAAWTRALVGSMDDPPDNDGPVAPVRAWEDWGCTGEALWEHGRSHLAYVDPDWLEVSAEIDAAELAVSGHEDVLAARAQWRECMASEGFGEWSAPELVSSALWEESWVFLRGEDGEPLPEPDLTSLAERERAAALADWDCRAEADYDAREHAARDELQAVALERLEPQLDAWLGTYWPESAPS